MTDESPRVIAGHIDPEAVQVIFGRLKRYLFCRNVMADEPSRVITDHTIPDKERIICGRFVRHLGQLAVTGLHR
jgi:hypothetical protein